MAIPENTSFSTSTTSLVLVAGGAGQEFIGSGIGAVVNLAGLPVGVDYNTGNLAGIPKLSDDSMTSDCSIAIPDSSVVGNSGLMIYFSSVTVSSSSAWCMEFWYKTNLATISSELTMVSYNGTNLTTYVAFSITTSRLLKVSYRAGGTTASVVTTSFTVTDQEWIHYSICRSGGVVKVFANGVQITTFTPSVGTLTTTQIYVGSDYAMTTTAPGWICGLRMYRQALRTADFTPPIDIPGRFIGSAALTTTPDTGTPPVDPSYRFITVDSYSQTRRGVGFAGTTDTSLNVPHISWTPYHVIAQCDRGGAWKPGRITPELAYVVPSDAVLSSPTFYCSTPGTTGTTEPTWPTSGTVTDGSVTWTYAGKYHPGSIYSVLDQ